MDNNRLDSQVAVRALKRIMAPSREALLSAAGYLCTAADNLRALGMLTLADEIDAFILSIDLELLLSPRSE